MSLSKKLTGAVAALALISGGATAAAADSPTLCRANKSRSHGAWYSDVNGEGTCQNMNAGAQVGYVGFWSNDRASSWRTNSPC